MNWQQRITVDPAVCHGKACIRGTRVMVSVILDNLAAGESAENIMRGYHLEREDVQAAMEYAADFARNRDSLYAGRGVMRFKIDQNLHDDLANLLLVDGHDVHTVYSEGLSGCDDPTLAQRCAAEQRVLVTLDLDFADIRAFPPAAYPGIIVLRVGNQSRQHVLNVMSRVLDLFKQMPLEGRLWIVSEAGVRIREG